MYEDDGKFIARLESNLNIFLKFKFFMVISDFECSEHSRKNHNKILNVI